MTNYNNTDKIIREKFESVDPVFDAESMWGELAPKVEKKRRRGFFLWMLSGVMVAIVSMVGFTFFSPQKVNVIDSVISMEEKAKDGDLISVVNANASLVDEDSKLNPLAEVKNDAARNNLTEIDLGDVDNTNDNIHLVTNSNSSVSNRIVNSTSTKPTMANDKRDFTLSTRIEALQSSKIIPAVDDRIRNEMNLLSALPVVVSSLQYTRRIEDVETYELGQGVYTQPLDKNVWRLAINGGYYIHSRSFKNSGADVSDNFSNRSMEEEAKDGYDLGIRLEYFLSDHFVLLGGVRFSQSFVQRSTEYAYTETITLKDHIVAIINTEQGPVEIKEDITYDGVFMHNADNYITATQLGLITGLQYRLRSDRWISHFDLGLEIPFWNSYSGVITNNRRPYNLSDETELINTSSIQIFGGIGVEYTLSPSTALQATIGGYMPLNNEHVEAYTIEKKSSLLGLNLGVHFRL